MKNTIFNRKLILSILMVMLVVCVLPSTSYGSCGFLCDIFEVVDEAVEAAGEAVEAAGEAVEAAFTATVEAVKVSAGAVAMVAEITNFTVGLSATLPLHTAVVVSTMFSPDGGMLASASLDLTIQLWDIHTELLFGTLEHRSPVLTMSFCPIDGCSLASGTDDGELHLWIPDTGQLSTSLTGHTAAVLSVAFSPVDHDVLASGSADGTIRLWNAETEAHQRTLTGHTDSVLTVAFPSDGGLLASGSADGTIRLWDAETGEHQQTFTEHTGAVQSVAFSFDGGLLASGSADGMVRLWDLATGELKAVLDHKSSVLSVAFSPRDSLFATGSADGTARLWDPLTWGLMATLGHESPVRSVAFNPDGGLLASGVEDGKVRQWQVALVPECCPRDPVKDFNTLSAAGNRLPIGLWSDGTTMWVADEWEGKLYAYDLSTKARDPVKDFNILSAAGIPLLPGLWSDGLWSDGTTMWVVDVLEGKLYAYDLSTKARDPVKDFNTLSAAGIHLPTGLWSDGTTMWVADREGKLYAYDLSTKARDHAKDFNTLSAAGNHLPTGLWSDGTTMWVMDGLEGKLYAYDLSTKARDPVKDFNTLFAAGNRFPTGLWSDGTTMWVADRLEGKLYAYDMPTNGNTPDADVPGTPTILVTPGAGSLTVSWSAPGGAAVTAYDLRYIRSAAADKTDTNWTVMQDIWTAGSGDLIYELTDLTGGTQYDVQVRAVNNSGDGPWSVTVTGTPTAHAKPVAIGLPEETQLQQNAPNPFNSETVISWSLREPGSVRLEVFSVTGQRVVVLRQGHQQAGYHRLHWDGRDNAGHSLASGIYLYRLETAKGVLTRKLTLLR